MIDKTTQEIIVFDYIPAVSYALYQNHVPVIKLLSVKNNTDKEWANLNVKITPEDDFAKPIEFFAEQIPPDTLYQPETINLKLNPSFIYTLTEKLSSLLRLTVLADGKEIYSETYEIDILAYDQWLGSSVLPEMISAFVMPNLPELSPLLKAISVTMRQWTENSALDDYQSQDPDRVKKLMAALYKTIAEKNITYCTVPASFGGIGQRVRMVDMVLKTKMANCLEMSLLYASALEAMGIHPILVVIEGHAFVGAWLIDDTFPDAVNDDPSLLTKRMVRGINEIILIEATAMNEGNVPSFDEAIELAGNHFNDLDKFLYFIDVHRSRFSGILPVPLRRKKGEDWEIITFDHPSENPVDLRSPVALESVVKLQHVKKIDYGKQQLWERKLLDLSLRNNLLNLRTTRSSLQFIPVPPNELEDAMADGEEFQILAKPKDWENPLRNTGVYQALHHKDPILQLVKKELKQHRLRVYLTEEELHKGLLHLYRNARHALEENGANTLYLAIGLLRWYETPSSQKPRFAPIMLMPVEIIRKSVKKGFIIRSREEETVLNVTLLEKLRQDYGLSLSGLDPLPRDESGVDVNLVFNIIRQTIMSVPRWDVEEQIFLGTFSFSKFIMWNDIHSNAEKLAVNPIVKGLIKGGLEVPLTCAREEHLDGIYGHEKLLLPISADASQLQAIAATVSGESFILHGPPGTGKSQTITNMIANMLYRGKRVLFVAEKMAALSVVQNRLEAIGLAPFCLELHSNKARKSEVLEQFRKVMEVAKSSIPENFTSHSKRLDLLRDELNQYVENLHEKQSCGFSLFELFNAYSGCKKGSDHVPFDTENLKTLNREQVQELMDVAEQLQTAALICEGASCEHPLYGMEISTYSSSFKDNLGNQLEVFLKHRKSLNDVLENIVVDIDWPHTSWDDEKLEEFNQMIRTINELPEVPENFFMERELYRLGEELHPLIDAGEKSDALKHKLLERFQTTILTAPVGEMLAGWNMASVQWFLPRYFAQKKLRKTVYGYLKTGKILKTEIHQILLDLLAYQENQKQIEDHKDFLTEKLGPLWRNGAPQWNKLSEALSGIQYVEQELLKRLPGKEEAYRIRMAIGRLYNKGYVYFKEHYGNLFSKLPVVMQQEEKERRATEKLVNCALDYEKHAGVDISLEKAMRWSQHLEQLKNWYYWTQVRKKAMSLNLNGLLEVYEKGELPDAEIKDTLCKSLYSALATIIIEQEEKLSIFNGKYFDTQISRFKAWIEAFTTLTQELLYAELAMRIPELSQGTVATSETGILQRAIKSKGRGKSLRQLFNEIPNLLPRIAPCMLMSPISVAQYLDIDNEPFDLVIFDEASQMPTSEAVGAIARGQKLIVVGDPKQMPPTSFFSSIHFDEEDSNEDLESILDDCQALSVPSRQLQWHYRSQHESLIAFSNAKYYDNSLFTFPSPDDRISRVRFIAVNGVYERGKTRQNRAEAVAIVKELIRQLTAPDGERKSIGVVTFSSVQQTLIEDLLNVEFANNPTLEEINNKQKEPLFIKNLENVQGDERDIILFSICYGPDKNGYISHNFGPLNREGGWRRLNVAVSRARYAMKVYSSLHADQIDLSRTRSEGVAGLKAFLAFAERGKKALPVSPATLSRNNRTGSLETSVADFLKEHGYRVETNIGNSGYQVDMAVIHPDKDGAYLAGILFDGANYRSGKSARDRHVIQPSVLKLLGWNIFRIWSLDLWEYREEVLQNLLEFLDRLKSGKTEEKFLYNGEESIEIDMPESFGEKIIEETVPKNALNNSFDNKSILPVINSPQQDHTYTITELPPLYNVSYEDFLSEDNTEKIIDQVQQVMAIEAPINESLLCKRILAAWDITRLGSRIQVRFDQIFKRMELKRTKDKDENVCFWRDDQVPEQYTVYRIPAEISERRSAEDLTIYEISNAVKEILVNQMSVPEEDLVRAVAKVFQYARVGGNVDTAMRQGIELAVEREMAVRDKNDRIVNN